MVPIPSGLPPDTGFIVSPIYRRSDLDGGVEFIVSFEITFRQHPVLILEVRPPQHLSLSSKREAADTQIRLRLVDLVDLGVWRRCR